MIRTFSIMPPCNAHSPVAEGRGLGLFTAILVTVAWSTLASICPADVPTLPASVDRALRHPRVDPKRQHDRLRARARAGAGPTPAGSRGRPRLRHRRRRYGLRYRGFRGPSTLGADRIGSRRIEAPQRSRGGLPGNPLLSRGPHPLRRAASSAPRVRPATRHPSLLRGVRTEGKAGYRAPSDASGVPDGRASNADGRRTRSGSIHVLFGSSSASAAREP